jgi:hypothetical protein
MATRNFKALSHTQQKLQNVTTRVEQPFPAFEETRTFRQKVPTAVIILIARGVTEFVSDRAQEMVIRSGVIETICMKMQQNHDIASFSHSPDFARPEIRPQERLTWSVNPMNMPPNHVKRAAGMLGDSSSKASRDGKGEDLLEF